MKLTLILTAFLLGITIARPSPIATADTPEPAPTGPLLRRAPDLSQWQVAFTYGGDKPKATPGAGLARTLQVTVIKTKPYTKTIVSESNGAVTEGWMVDKERFAKPPGGPFMERNDTVDVKNFVFAGTDSPFLTCYEKADFPDFDWISRDNFAGYDKSHTLLVFHEKAEHPMTAWIDSATRLPVRWEKDDEVRKFAYGPPPAAQLKLPPEIQQLLADFARIQKTTNWAPGRH